MLLAILQMAVCDSSVGLLVEEVATVGAVVCRDSPRVLYETVYWPRV